MGWGPALVRCVTEICSGRTAAARIPPTDAPQVDPRCQVFKPVLRLDESEQADDRLTTPEDLISSLGMLPAPPGATSAHAVVSADFQGNSSRLMVLVPGAGVPSGSWEPRLGGCGSSASLLRWADANGFSSALFFSQHLETAPAEVWEGVLKGSPAKFGIIVVGSDMMPSLQVALSSMHSLLFSRFRVVCTVPGRNGSHGAGFSPSLPQDLRKHLSGALVQLPLELWSSPSDGKTAHQDLFERVLARQDRLENVEIKKYSGFQNLKENDMPGLKRLGVEERVGRLDRDRGNDELARLCHANLEEDEEPGVD